MWLGPDTPDSKSSSKVPQATREKQLKSSVVWPGFVAPKAHREAVTSPAAQEAHLLLPATDSLLTFQGSCAQGKSSRAPRG